MCVIYVYILGLLNSFLMFFSFSPTEGYCHIFLGSIFSFCVNNGLEKKHFHQNAINTI